MDLDHLNRKLIVSCQPVSGGPMDRADMVVGFALAAISGGARGLRIESAPYVAAVRAATHAPIIGLMKRDLNDSPVRITPFLSDVAALSAAGADIVAFDATRRHRPAPVAELVKAIHANGRIAMADCSDEEDARTALAVGADIVGSTMSGYTGGPETTEPDYALIAAMRRLTPRVVAEGRIRTPDQAAEAIRCGAWAVVVGSAITRPEHVTAWFRSAIGGGEPDLSILALDIGGTKLLAALVSGRTVVEERQVPTDIRGGPDRLLDAVAELAAPWQGRYLAVGAAVTGLIRDGRWRALNVATLDVREWFPLAEALAVRLGAPIRCANDAHAAAWGEYREGAGARRDMVFLTVSTGLGGGIVLGGRLLEGLAGHFGQFVDDAGVKIEDRAAGRWMAAEAVGAGHSTDAAGVFAAAGEAWADCILAEASVRIATLCRNIKLAVDPERIVIGGSIGLAPGFRDRIAAALDGLEPEIAPRLVSATLGTRAGVIGAAALAAENFTMTQTGR